MPRPKKIRFVTADPLMTGFLPENIAPSGDLTLSMEGLEAIRLSDFEGLDQEAAAAQMGISRQTFGRILTDARRVAAEALVTGKRLVIGGGTYAYRGGRGRRRRRRGSFQDR
jgi:predicted DNA-binding protein (UPF0251 family)